MAVNFREVFGANMVAPEPIKVNLHVDRSFNLLRIEKPYNEKINDLYSQKNAKHDRGFLDQIIEEKVG